MSIIYKKGNLFDAPKGSLLVHACNCVGAWGPVIAAQFKERFAISFKDYQLDCRFSSPGNAFISHEKGYAIGCLYTSYGYSKAKDSEETILKNTKNSLDYLSRIFNELYLYKEIHSPKINAGQFKVPWEKTEALINEFLEKNPEVTWTVWEL